MAFSQIRILSTGREREKKERLSIHVYTRTHSRTLSALLPRARHTSSKKKTLIRGLPFTIILHGGNKFEIVSREHTCDREKETGRRRKGVGREGGGEFRACSAEQEIYVHRRSI